MSVFKATNQARTPPRLTCHLDRMSQDTSTRLRTALTAASAGPTTNRGVLDQPLAERFFATRETEQASSELSREVARLYLYDFPETFYHRPQRDQSLGSLAPVAFEIWAYCDA